MDANFQFTKEEEKTLKDFTKVVGKLGNMLNSRVEGIKSGMNKTDLEKLNEICGDQLPDAAKELKTRLNDLNNKIKSL